MSDFYCDEVFSGRTHVNVVQETPDVIAFEHTRPAYDLAHIVVVPRQHVLDFLEVDDRVLASTLEVVRDQARRVVDQHGACRVITNVGAYQDSKHLHWHVVCGDRLPVS